MAAPYRFGQMLGWLAQGANGVAQNQNAAANWYAWSFFPDSARTLSTVRVYQAAVTGTLGASDVTMGLYDSTGSSGVPGSSIETGKLPSATITAAGWYTFTGFSTALSVGQEYWLVQKNGNGTPASNYPSPQSQINTGLLFNLGSSTNRHGWTQASSTNSGSTWSRNTGIVGLRIGYADGTFDGTPLANSATVAGSGDGVYSTRESGTKFTSPANVALKVVGLAMLVSAKTGTPTGNPRMGLWTGSTPTNQGYTAAALTTTIGGQLQFVGYFASPITIPASTVCRVTLAETTQSDAVGNRYNCFEFTGDTDSNSQILMPWNGTATKTYYNGSSWTDSTIGASIIPHALLLDPAGEFGSAGGSGGVLISPGWSGGFRG